MRRSGGNAGAIGLSTGDNIFTIINGGILTIILIIVLYPILFTVGASLSDPMAVLSGEMWLWPRGFTMRAYERIFQSSDLMRGYGNTLNYTVIGTTVNVLLTIAAAYPLSRKDFTGRNVITALFVFTMFFSGGLIPTYLLVRELGLVNSMWALILPGAVSMWYIVIMRTFFQTGIPAEMQEAAQMDGCTNMGLLVRIVLPLSMPVIAVLILFYGVSHWNSYFEALIYLSDRRMYPLQLFLREILLQSQTLDVGSGGESFSEQLLQVESLKYAIIIAANLPMFILYPWVQRYFVKGVMIGALKG